jgi:peptide/nickel transport system substrate-binding protein
LVDVESILKNIERGLGTRTVSPVHPLKKTFNTSLIPVDYNIEKSKKLLDEAGWKDSDNNGILDRKADGKSEELELEILISGQELGKKIAILLQENALKVGVKIKITEKDFKLIRTEHIKTRKYQLVPSLLSQDLQAWDDMSKWHSENDTPDGSNEMSYRNPVTDKLIDQIIITKDDEKRKTLYKEIQVQIYNDQPAIFLYAPEERIVISKKWQSSATAKRPGYLANTFKPAIIGEAAGK